LEFLPSFENLIWPENIRKSKKKRKKALVADKKEERCGLPIDFLKPGRVVTSDSRIFLIR